MSRSVSAPSSVTNTSPCWNGDIVPGSTLMYGSSLMRVTLRPRDSRIAAREAEAIPLPREDTTPPVTKTNLVMSGRKLSFREVVKRDYMWPPRLALRACAAPRGGFFALGRPGGEEAPRLPFGLRCPRGGFFALGRPGG